MAISGTLAETELLPMRDAVLEVDIGSVDTWVAIESFATQIEPTRGGIPISSEKTLDGSTHLSYGIKDIDGVRVTVFATEASTGPLYNLYDQLGAACDVRWSQNGASNELRWYTNAGRVTDCQPPGQNANNSENKKFVFQISTANISKEVIPT